MNPFLEGHFAPVADEVTGYDLPVTGHVPAELDGRYLRIGPNPLKVEDAAAHHWTRGEGMVHGVRLRDGRAEWYRNRWVRSLGVAEQLGEPHPGGAVVPELDFAANTHVVALAGRTFALIESGPRPYALDGELRTAGAADFGGTLTGAFTAHPKLDAAAGELHAVTYLAGSEDVKHLVLDGTGRVARARTIAVPGGPYVHDFSLTGRYVVVYDLPLTFSIEAVAAGRPVPFAWHDDHPARVGLLPRAGGEACWMPVEPCLLSHSLNAYDEGSSVVADVVTLPAGFDIGDLAGNRGLAPVLERWRIDPVAGTVHRTVLDDRPQDFPRINDLYTARRHRYGYTAVTGPLNETRGLGSGNALLKHDLDAGVTEVHPFPGDSAVGEAVFVPAASAAAEDDGYLLCYAHNPSRGAADLVILSARSFTEPPLARVHLPARVPLGFHSAWLPC